MLSKQAFNALLKTLEEPPEYLKFIFATTEIKKIPITVLSRCQRFDLSRIKSSELFKFIKGIKDKEKGNVSDDALKLIVKISEGSVRDALSLLDRGMLSVGSNEELNLKKAQFSNIQRSLSALESKEIYLDSILKAYSVNSSSTQNNLLGFLNRKAQELDITIIEFNEPHIVTEENSTVSSYNFILQGSFEEIQSMLYEIEKNRAFGSLKNVTFQKKKNFRKGTDYLECTIVLSQ